MFVVDKESAELLVLLATYFLVLLSAEFFAVEHWDSNANAINRVFIYKETIYELLFLTSEVYTYIYIKASEHIVS